MPKLTGMCALVVLSFLLTGCVPVVWEEETFSVAKESDIVYGQGLTHSQWNSADSAPMDLLLDVYTPENAPGIRPAVVLIHGGGFVGGSKTMPEMVAFADFLVPRGFVCISIDYRLTGDMGTVAAEWLTWVDALDLPEFNKNMIKAMYPAARDAKAAVRWLHAEAESLNVHPGCVSIIGGSAGSFLTLMLGVTEPEDYRDEIDPATDTTLTSTHLESSARVHTLIDHWGGTAHVDCLDTVWGRKRWDATDAPVSIVHGTADDVVPFTEAEKIRDNYESTGVAYAFHPLQDQGHASWGAQVDGKTLPELAFEFIVQTQQLTVRAAR